MSSGEEESVSEKEYSDSDILSDSDVAEPEDRSFGEQFWALLNEPIPAGKCPILFHSKIPGKLQKKREEQNRKEREATHLAQAKKTMLNSKHRPIEEFDDARERAIRKVAKRGVLAILNSSSRATVVPQILEPVKKEEVPQKQEEILDLLMQAAVKSSKK